MCVTTVVVVDLRARKIREEKQVEEILLNLSSQVVMCNVVREKFFDFFHFLSVFPTNFAGITLNKLDDRNYQLNFHRQQKIKRPQQSYNFSSFTLC